MQYFLRLGIEGSGSCRCELYVQLMKQLTSNPNPSSERRGWDMMAMCVACFPPPPSLENILAVFLKNKVHITDLVHAHHPPHTEVVSSHAL